MSESITDLIAKLKQYDAEYHTDGESSIPDKDYDKLRRQAQQMDPGNDYFASVGSDLRGGKEKLPHTMGSLDQIHDGKDLALWKARYGLTTGKVIVASDKEDGISAMLVYRKGQLEKAYSRGNGVEGADITRHVRNVPSVPKSIKGDAYVVVRGELIMDNPSFAANHAKDYKNPRNMVAGCFNRTTTAASTLADVTFIAYQVVEYSDVDMVIDSKQQEFEFLLQNGFAITPYTVFDADDLSDDFLKKFTLERKQISKFELDGVVLTIDKFDAKTDAQRKSRTTLNPEHSAKFKIVDLDSVVITDVVAVLWEISKSGFFKPRIQVRPVNLYGTTVTYATGFNAKFIFENSIGPGAKVQITKSGSVIPYIMAVTAPAKEPQMPENDWEWNENMVEAVTTDDDNDDVKFKQVLSFFESLSVDHLKEGTFQTVWDRLLLKDLSYEDIIITLFELTGAEWNKLVGANGLKIADSLERRGMTMTLEAFLGATKYLGFGFGVRKAKALLAQIDEADLKVASVNVLAGLDGFDTKTAQKVRNGLPLAYNLLDILVAEDLVRLVKEVKTAELKGLNVVFTGFRDPDLEKTIEGAGGKVGSSVSSKTTHLLCIDPSAGSSKLKKAKDLGVELMTAEQFKDTYNL